MLVEAILACFVATFTSPVTCAATAKIRSSGLSLRAKEESPTGCHPKVAFCILAGYAT
jgi:hypothetical protein